MHNTRPSVFLWLALALLPACSSAGYINMDTNTGVSLERRNFRTVKAGARGTSSGFWLFGLIPFFSPTYADAKRDLYDSTGQRLEGRAIALANQTEDRAFRYFVLFSLPRLTLSADIVEFVDEPDADKRAAPARK